jgi:predicted MPP superfamily phosphohydrolase
MSNAPRSLNSQASLPTPVVQKPTSESFPSFRWRRFRRLVLTVQSILLVANLFLYATWIAFHPSLGFTARVVLGIVAVAAGLSFVAVSLLTWSYFNWVVRVFYTMAAVWVGLMNFCLFAACASWIALGATRVAGLKTAPNLIADGFFSAALLVGLYGVVNAATVRVNRISVKLPNLPERWRGRVAALVSDLHLGHIRNLGFMRRMVARLNQIRPDIVFIAGDLYDGTRVDANALAEPWSALSVPLGALYVTGNHEEFSNRAAYLHAVASAGVRVLNNEKIELDGLQIIGIHYGETVDPEAYRSVLRKAAISPERASVLIVHAPHRLTIAEEAGVSLQVSGHTHGGQFPPGSWVASRVYGPFVHGLHRLGKLLVFTNWGAGTWGPPLRVGTNAEIVLITFETA